MPQCKFPKAVVILMCLALMAIALNQANAQDTRHIKGELKIPEQGHKQILILADGSRMIGAITEISENEVILTGDFGETKIPIGSIKEIKDVEAASIKGDGDYWFPDPNRTRLYFGPTGYMLDRGKGYFADFYLFFPGFAYGLTNNISIGGGMSIFPGVDFDKQIFFFTPKIGVGNWNKLGVAAAAIIVRVPVVNIFEDEEDESSKWVGVLFGTGTYGSQNAHATFGLGYGFAAGELADKPAVLLGGQLRTSRRMALVTENWIFPEVDNPLVSYGVRFLGEGLSVDLALVNVLSEDAIFPGLPYIDFVWSF